MPGAPKVARIDADGVEWESQGTTRTEDEDEAKYKPHLKKCREALAQILASDENTAV